MKCENCGTEIEKNALFCPSCGAKVKSANSESATETAFPGNEKNTGNETLEKLGRIIIGGLSLISVILLVGAFFGVFDKNPIPFIIFIGVKLFFGWFRDKFHKIPTIVFAVLEIIALITCFNLANDVGAVESIKSGCPNDDPNITYEKAFNDYFADPIWKSIGKDEDGNEIVKFTGSCNYLDEEAIAEIKFTIYKEQGSFVVSSVKINGNDMQKLGNGIVMDVFEEYQQNHN